ncbi:hypothetical protein ACLD9W_11670 [Neisseria sp. WLZKY-1]|uniref:hypothetical protein n=1 Tax=Neisseria sp. WLZKY-1 TaxID=3390377 RepID=UPI00397B69A7
MWLIRLKNLFFISVLLLCVYLFFSYLNSDVEDFGSYQFEYVRDKGWPADYILVQKIEEDGKKKGKLLFGLVINFYQEGNYVYFSYIEGENIASQSCYSKKEISYGKINIKNNSLEIIDKNDFSRNHTLPNTTKMWLEDSENRCN